MPGILQSGLIPTVLNPLFFPLGEPKPELKNQPQIKIIKIPRRLGSLVMAAEMAWGSYDLIYYPPFGRRRKLFKIFNIVGKKKPIVFPVEATAQQILAADPALRREFLQVLRTTEARYAIGPNIAKTVAQELGLRAASHTPGGGHQGFLLLSIGKKIRHR